MKSQLTIKVKGGVTHEVQGQESRDCCHYPHY